MIGQTAAGVWPNKAETPGADGSRAQTERLRNRKDLCDSALPSHFDLYQSGRLSNGAPVGCATITSIVFAALSMPGYAMLFGDYDCTVSIPYRSASGPPSQRACSRMVDSSTSSDEAAKTCIPNGRDCKAAPASDCQRCSCCTESGVPGRETNKFMLASLFPWSKRTLGAQGVKT
ncbi:hypothetical protein BDZ85DRAFT_293392 [Elsinoe ampelina]|uniref:Uncharacterized protein n=1 Tax=Elsinoe ampelina TaxID=302913 RepID=A0A6A6GLN0_9PEZI|nr:hypothetical protein BDZ85DRAFT_293392 [Elsinoe ampelina]